MRKRRVILGVLLLASAGVVGVLVGPGAREREPEYGGKRLSEWVLALDRQNPESVRKEAEEAIRHIGNQAVPYLVKWMGYETPAWKIKLYRLLNPMLGRFKVSNENELRRSILAGAALLNCGLDAEGSIGELSRLANNPNAKGRLHAINVLGQLGRPGLQALVEVLTNEEPRLSKSGAVGTLSAKSSALCCTLSADAAKRLYFVDPDRARLAVPALVSLLQDGDRTARQAATNALLTIDPTALGWKVGPNESAW